MIGPFVSLLIAGASPTPLVECRRLEQAFDTAAMPAPCALALDDGALPVADRVDAARLLAFALVTNGDAAGGETAFLRLLTLAPGWTQPSSASPRLRDAFGKARARLASVGAVTATATATADGDGWELVVDVVDPLGRVAAAGWSLGAADGASPPSAGARAREAAAPHWTARLPKVVATTCVVQLRAADGTEVASAPCTGFVRDAASLSPGVDVPWVALGVSAGAVVVVGVAVGTLVWAVNAGPLAPPAAVTVTIE
jgi:hypothetical protein